MASDPIHPTPLTSAPRTSILEVLRRYWWFMAVVTIVALGATYAFTQQQTPTYAASTRVLLRTNETLPLFPLSATAPEALRRSAEVELLYTTSPEFTEAVRRNAPAGVSVSTRAGSSELVFTARGEDPESVAEAANLWASTYVTERHSAVLAEQSESAEFVRAQLEDLDAERTMVRAELEIIEGLIDEASDPEQVSRLLVQKVTLESALQSELVPLDQQISDLRRQLSNFEFIDRFMDTEEISARVLREARTPTSPVSPNLLRNLAVGGFLGMAVGFALPWARLALSDTIGQRTDISAAAALPVLAAVPSYEHESDRSIEVLERPTSIATEHYQALLTAIEFASIGQPARSVLFTSAVPGEGKTTTAINVAALAAQYLNVIVVDADMRRPSVHEVTGLSNKTGLCDVLAGRANFRDVRQSFSHGTTSFDVITAGPTGQDPARLLRRDAWKELVEQLYLYDLVVVDGPPVLAVTDALLLGRAVDGQVLLVRFGSTERKTLAAAAELLSTNGSRTLGAVVNRTVANQGGYQYYGYSYEALDEQPA